jgi:hypothetical protein
MFLRQPSVLTGIVRRTPHTGALSTARRSYQTHRVAMLNNLNRSIKTIADGKAAIHEVFTFLELNQFLVELPGCLTVVSTPEFWANGQLGADKTWEFGAGDPLPLEIFEAMVAESREWTRRLPPGIVVVFGGVAIDTGLVAPDGKKIGANVSWIVESGPDGSLVYMNKANTSTIDGWDLDVFVPDAYGGGKVGPINFVVTDGRTGEKHVITVYCCLDMTEALPPEKLPGDQVVMAVSAGAPLLWKIAFTRRGVARGGATVAVNEGVAALRGKSDHNGVFVATADPLLHDLFAEATRSGLEQEVIALRQAVVGYTPSKAAVSKLFPQVTTSDGRVQPERHLHEAAPVRVEHARDPVVGTDPGLLWALAGDQDPLGWRA